MIYLTQLIFIKPGKENIFHEFEDFAIPLMEKYGGEIIYRIRPKSTDFINEEKPTPYEIHFLSFESDEALAAFMKDDGRLNFVHLKEESVESVFLVKGEKL